MYFRLAFALFLSGLMFSSAVTAMSDSRSDSRDDNSSETRGHKSVTTDDDAGPSRSGYIIASS